MSNSYATFPLKKFLIFWGRLKEKAAWNAALEKNLKNKVSNTR